MKKTGIAAVITGLLCLTLLAGCSQNNTQPSQGQTSGQTGTQEQQTTQAAEQETTHQGYSAEAAVTTDTESDFCNLTSFTAETLDGSIITQDVFAGKDVTILHVWATTCGPCITELPDIAAFAETLPDNVQLITYCADAGYFPEEAKALLDEAGFKGITIIGGDGDFAAFARQLMYTPTTVFVDSSGKMIGNGIIGSSHDAGADYTEYINNAVGDIL